MVEFRRACGCSTLGWFRTPALASLWRHLLLASPGVLEDGLSSNGVLRSAAPGGIANPEKKMNCGTQCPNSQSLSSGPLTQKQNGLWTTEVGAQPQNQLGTGEQGWS